MILPIGKQAAKSAPSGTGRAPQETPSLPKVAETDKKKALLDTTVIFVLGKEGLLLRSAKTRIMDGLKGRLPN